MAVVAVEPGVPITAASARRVIVATFCVQVVTLVFLQKVGINADDKSLGLGAIVMTATILGLFAVGIVTVDLQRLVVFGLLLASMMPSMALQSDAVSLPSMILLIALYANFVFVIRADRKTVLSCLECYQVVLRLIAWIVIGQQIIQYTVGARYWPNLNAVIPDALRISGYAYLRPYTWNSPYITPNGIFFLEPSSMSGCLAVSFAIEVIFFKRFRHLMLLGVGLIAGVAGSGPTILVLFAPFLAARLDRRILALTIVIGVPLFLAGLMNGSFDRFVDRSAEFADNQSSAYARFVVPFEATLQLMQDSSYILSGNGPGSTPKLVNLVQWPANKMIYEYGLLASLLFHVFIVLSVLRNPPSRIVAAIILVPHLFFGGGFLSHVNVAMLVMFGSLLWIDERGEGASAPEPKVGTTGLGRLRGETIAAGR